METDDIHSQNSTKNCEIKASTIATLVNDLQFSYHHTKSNHEDEVVFEFDNDRTVRVSRFILLARSKWYRNTYKDTRKKSAKDAANSYIGLDSIVTSDMQLIKMPSSDINVFKEFGRFYNNSLT